MSNHHHLEITEKVAIEADVIAQCRARQTGWEHKLVLWLNTDSSWLLRRCTARLGSVSDAEDALQDITLKVMRAIEQFKGRSTLRTWVIRIADNHCYTLIKRRNATALSDHLQHSILLMEADRFNSTTDDETQIQVGSVLQALSANNREILQLRFFGDLSLDDMAKSLNLSLSATKMRLYRAMDVFKQKYEKSEINNCDSDCYRNV